MSAQLGLSVLFELTATDGRSGFSGTASRGFIGAGAGAGEERVLPESRIAALRAKEKNPGSRALQLVAMTQDIGSPVVAWASISSMRHRPKGRCREPSKASRRQSESSGRPMSSNMTFSKRRSALTQTKASAEGRAQAALKLLSTGMVAMIGWDTSGGLGHVDATMPEIITRQHSFEHSLNSVLCRAHHLKL